MSRMYLANCTKQTQIIFYRLDYNSSGDPNTLRRFQPAKSSQPIPRGRQIPLGGDLEMAQIEDIVKQLEKVGLRGEIDIGRLDGVTPYIFNIDKPVKAASISAVLAHNAGVLLGQGQVRREAAALAAKTTLESHAATDDIIPHNYEATIEQEEISDAGEKRIEEGFRVTDRASDVPDGIREKRTRGRPRKTIAA